MNRWMWKSTLMEIRKSLGRYMAILAIVALGVGTFCGLKVMRDVTVGITSGGYIEIVHGLEEGDSVIVQ